MNTREIIDMDGNKCGIVGDITPLLYKDGTHVQVGDVVINTRDISGVCGETFIVEGDGYYRSMGLKNGSLDGNMYNDWTIVPSKKILGS